MNTDSLPLCEEIARRGGRDARELEPREVRERARDLKLIKIPCNDIAEEIGDVKIANMVMMGALSKVTGAVKLDKLEAVLKTFFPESKHRFIPMNMQAIEAGRAAV